MMAKPRIFAFAEFLSKKLADCVIAFAVMIHETLSGGILFQVPVYVFGFEITCE
jgi:hypothetical protein